MLEIRLGASSGLAAATEVRAVVSGQTLASLVYLAILAAALLMPYAAWGKAPPSVSRLVIAAIAGCAVVLTAARPGALPVLALVLLLPFLGLRLSAALGAICALLLFLPVTWWTTGVNIGAAAATLLILRLLRPITSADTAKEKAAPAILIPMGVAALFGIAAGLLTAPFGAREPIYFAWHHWGAYLSPVEAWLGGGLPYRDFPIQYGLGPTATLALACGSDCWRGMFGVTVAANALYFAVLTGCALILTARSSRALRCLSVAALACACFVWTAFPANLGSTAMTPSVAGLRFLPATVLLLHILYAEFRGGRRDWLGHALWAANLLWSPESAFFGTLIWWAYLALRDAAAASSKRDAWLALVRGALHAVAALGVGVACLALVLWLLSGGAVRPADFLAYILNPPGRLPVNPLGTVWLAMGSILLALAALAGIGKSGQGRALYACLVAFLGAGTYYLSRSHDNNILNLFPLLLVLLLAIVQARESGTETAAFNDGFIRTALIAMVVFTATVGRASWREGAATEGLFNIGPSRLIARFSPQEGDRPQMLPADAARGLEELRRRNAGAVVLLDDNKLMPHHPGGQAWTSVNNVANYEPLPPAVITRYICRSAMAYRRPGWMLVDQRKYGAWGAMFLAAYDIREQADFGTYRAYKLAPRPGPLACAEL